MKPIRTASQLAPGNRKVCLAIGVFDGVHLGHQQIIRQTVADARKHDGLALVVTFDKHPSVIVAPDRVPPLIYSHPQKIRAIKSLGADALLEIHFDQEFSQQTGETFIRGLVQDLCFGGARLGEPPNIKNDEAAAGHRPALQSRVQSICVGADFVFGNKRSGNVALLKTLGEELQFTVHGMAQVSLDGQVVSSTRIREAIRAGDFDAASQMLGRAYSFAGAVVHGDQIGHKLGFPTANLDTTGLLLPPNGVYAAHASIAKKSFRAVLNIGHRPTVSQPTPQLRVEVHLLDFSDEIYGQDMEVTFAAKLRDEQKFPSVEALCEQIARDVAEAKRRF